MSMEENLRKYIDELIQEVEQELDEATTTAGVDGYQTPFAFGGGRDKDKKKQKKNIDVTGYTKVKDIDESIVTEGKDEVTSQQLQKIQSDVQKINRKITAKISTHPATKGRLTISIPEDGNWEGDTEKVTKVVKKHTGDRRTGIIMYESVNEAKTYKKGDKLKIKLKNGKKFDVVFDVYAKQKGVAFGKFKDGSGEYDTKPFDLDTIVESVNEAKVKRPVNRWLELKNDDTMTANKKMAMGLKELKYQLAETEKFFNWYNKIKNINELDSDKYWKRTNKHIYKIKERLVNIARTIKEIEK